MPSANSTIATSASAASAPQIRDFFVCIGAQKSGTTWLARVLSSHPDLFMSPVKELHYFDHVAGLTQHLSERKLRSRNRKFLQRLLTQWHRFRELKAQRSWYKTYLNGPIDDAWYVSLFREREGKPFAGEATPEYAIIGEEGFRHLARVAPEARLLFIMRNPVTRAWSQALHHCRTTHRDAMRLSTAELIRIMEDAPNFEPLCDYAATLATVGRVFPTDQIMTMFYEDMHQDREGSLRKVCSFIGIGFDAKALPELGKRFNRSQDVPMPDEMRAHLRERLRDQASRVKAITGRIPPAWERDFGL
jgi:Sulfotransferase family